MTTRSRYMGRAYAGLTIPESPKFIDEAEIPEWTLVKSRWFPIFEKIPDGKALILEDITKAQLSAVRSSLHNLQKRYGLLKGYRFITRKDLDGKVNGYVIHGAGKPTIKSE